MFCSLLLFLLVDNYIDTRVETVYVRFVAQLMIFSISYHVGNYASTSVYKLKIGFFSDAEYPVDAQVPFLPPTVLLVKSMLLIAPAALSCGPWNCAKLIFCSHHPCISFNGRRDAVWKVILSTII